MATQLTQAQRQVQNAAVFREGIMNLHMAAVPVILVRTREPFRAADTLREFAFGEEGLAFKSWSIVHGWATYDKANADHAPQVDGLIEPLLALRAVGGAPAPSTNNRGGQAAAWADGIYVMMYPHLINLNKNPALIHVVKEYSRLFAENRKRLVFITTTEYELPPELTDDVVILDFDPPSYAELSASFDSTVAPLPEEKRPVLSSTERDRILSIGAGMTMSEFENAVSRALVENRNDLPNVSVDSLAGVMASCKTDVVKKTDVLELMQSESAENIGGLQPLKDWMLERVVSFTDAAREFGIEPPRGIMLIGPPGTGKSLVAKATSQMLGLPLIKFDVSRVFQSLVGSSEARIRATLKLVDAMAPCVLFFDELDKALGGTTSGQQGDSGVGQRILGTILTWLQESTAPVFVVATANRVEFLPPELMRRGRMDEVFSVQMPSEAERMAILRIHLAKRGHDPAKIKDLAVAVEASQGYVGAEIEAAVKDTLIKAFTTKSKKVTGAMIAALMKEMKPLSEAFPEQFHSMAAWAANNARPANEGEPPAPVRSRTRTAGDPAGSRALDLDG